MQIMACNTVRAAHVTASQNRSTFCIKCVKAARFYSFDPSCTGYLPRHHLKAEVSDHALFF
ncbi:hypothetical protein SAMN04515695_1276 [Pseudovibrio sp. Tun.PSC04-5.I4]|nr:hypothetical protein SAMN04515695_1276 [Pseudovibrio sp. Tun.PSC04-5.I4]